MTFYQNMENSKSQKHFVLVHGACHGAWCWYKVKPLLESSGHRVTALNMAASGIDMTAIQDVHTIEEYTKPLLEFLEKLPKNNEKVIVVGHSLGGFNLAVAMEKFPEKIDVAVFLTAFMPDIDHRPSFILDQFDERTPTETWLDTQFAPYSSSLQHLTTIFFGPKVTASKFYQLSPVEDRELAKALLRPSSFFVYDLSKAKNFSTKGYGSVKRVYILCGEDKIITEEFQRWMIENHPVEEVIKIDDADHMAMFSKPKELGHRLLEIADKYA
ncbi:salicylic acid-binding protein 2-like [Mercurialis annua]|uniref:salicylic acid-binding protein 2-like n=1 Tax=Mercurialis annua TaxID=3986 RepID=UPI00215E28A8|nr:salicylic acid-binding protein 2-like [Mercurialis annua]